jgi:phage repressor protein C with HTH and peptisase S24 domain
MEPTLFSSDLVLVDHSRDYLAPEGGLYAVAVGQEIMVKRLQAVFPGKKIRIISDNPRYEPMEADPERININGKVIWFGREIKE